MGMTFRSTNVDTDNIHLELYKGWGGLEVRGKHVVIPSKEGQTEMPVVKHERIIPVRGWVKGTGATLEEQQQSWLVARDALDVLMDPSLASGELVVTAPDMGLSGSASRSISAYVNNEVAGPIEGGTVFQRVTYELVCIADPPDWIAESS